MILENYIKNEKKKVKLSELKIGEIGRITDLNIDNKIIKRHLLDMGLVKGTIVKIKKISPLGDPVCLGLRGYELCLRKIDLEKIYVEVI